MLYAALAVVLAIAVALILQIDDWSRDLSTNRAATSADADDPTLRSLVLDTSIDDVRDAIARFAERTPAWAMAKANADNQIALTRTTRLFGFVDDVIVTLQSTDAGTQVDVVSQSRVGKGDLGQNPRNIRELLRTLRDELATANQAS